MGVFHDKNGKVWEFHLGTGAVRRCVDLAGFSPLDIAKKDSNLLPHLAEDILLAANMLYACCKPQADADGVSDSDFGELLNGDSLDEGLEALVSEVVGFSQKSKRPLMKKVFDKQKELTDKAVAMAMEEIENPETMKRIEDKMRADLRAALLGDGSTSVTNSPALSE